MSDNSTSKNENTDAVVRDADDVAEMFAQGDPSDLAMGDVPQPDAHLDASRADVLPGNLSEKDSLDVELDPETDVQTHMPDAPKPPQ